jgi:hypothetical protein
VATTEPILAHILEKIPLNHHHNSKMLNLDPIKTAILQLSPTHQQQIKQWLTTLNQPDLSALIE